MNLNISERDKKLLLILAFVAVAILPYFLLTQKVMEKNTQLAEQNGRLKERKSELQGYALNQDTYISESERMLSEAQEILNAFPSAYTQENDLMFMYGIERRIPIELRQISFGDDLTAQQEEKEKTEEEKNIADDGTEITEETKKSSAGSMTEIIATSQYTFFSTYEGLKAYLNYIKNYKSRMVIGNLAAKGDGDFISGTFTLTQYALTGTGRENYDFKAPEYRQGSSNLFLAANGMFEEVEDNENYVADFVIRLSSAEAGGDTVMVGKNGDPDRETFLTSKDNEGKEITISFTGSDGNYDATYSIDDESNDDEPVSFSADGVIYVDVISSKRTSEEDIVEAVISVLNASDVRVIVHVLNDPEPPDTRVRFSGNTQNVEVREE